MTIARYLCPSKTFFFFFGLKKNPREMPARLLAFCRGFALKKKKLGLLPCYVSLYYLFPNSCKSESLLLVAFLPSNLEKGLFFLCSSSTDPVFGFHISPLPVYFDTFFIFGPICQQKHILRQGPTP